MLSRDGDIVERRVDCGFLRFAQVVPAGIASHSDDLSPHGIGIIANGFELLANRVLAVKELFDESLIHDHRWRVARDLFGKKVAAGNPPDLHRLEETGGNGNFPERNSTATVKPISAASIQRSAPARPECWVARILSAAPGDTEEPRSAGTMPNSSTVTKLSATVKKRVAASGATSSQAGNSGEPRRA